jgi:hypothetical protein
MIAQNIKGLEGIKLVLESALDNNEKLLRTALSGKPLVYLLGKDFAEEYMSKRRDSEIFLKSLRFSSEDVDIPKHKEYESYNKEVRIAPEEIKIDYSVIIWDDFVAVVDSIKIYGTVIQDERYSKIMKQWFDFIWSKSS